MSRTRLTNLAKLIDASRCRAFGWEEVRNGAHKAVLGALIQGFDHPDSTVLSEPSLARKTTCPPDVVLVDVTAGVHVIEVKGMTLDKIGAIEPGGQIRFLYESGPQTKNPVAQVRNAMFDIKDATARASAGELVLPFKYWVVMPQIRRTAWMARWGDDAFCPPELLFAEDMPGLADRLREVGKKQLVNKCLKVWPADQIAAVWSAFGDSSVLYHLPEEREARRVPEGTLGERFDEAAEGYKMLSDEQQRLSVQNWTEGPRLVRGVAGSGKSIVLANNLARRLHRDLRNNPTLFERNTRPLRWLAVCFNRSLVPFLRKKIELAFLQRTGRPLPKKGLEVFSHNELMWRLSQRGLWRYQKLGSGDEESRAAQYLKDLEDTKRHHSDTFNAAAYDAIYIDEGQDFLEADFRLFKELCRVPEGGEPNLYIFYDDAQNLYGRKRPNWNSLDLSVRGRRAYVMTQCFRTTRPIVETAFNVLYGSFASGKSEVPTKEFGDIATLEHKHLIAHKDGFWRVRFAVRNGLAPRLTMTKNPAAEVQELILRLRWLIEEEKVRPQDILVLAYTRRRIEEISAALQKTSISGVDGLHIAFHERDKILGQRGTLTLSTVASSKGYDAYCALLASANEFTTDVKGRVSFYVGCTRAIEYLEVFAHQSSRLVPELRSAIDATHMAAATVAK